MSDIMFKQKHLDSHVTKQSCNKIRIAFVLWSLEGMGGSEHVVFDIVRKLNKEIFDILIVSFKEGDVRSIYEKIGIKVAVVSKRKKFDFEFIRSLRTIFNESRIQVVNAHHYSPLLYSYLATRMTKIKIVYTEHSVWQYREMNTAERFISNFLLWESKAIVAISNKLFQYYCDNIFVSNNKIKLILNGIDLSHFKNVVNSSMKRALGFKPDDILIGMIANLRPEKNHKVLISAFSCLFDKLINSHLILVGLDCMNGDIQQFASDTGCSDRIHFLGSREDVADILNALDVFCLPSKHEGLPLTVLEAMACGVPVVGADVMGINEVVSHNENGLLFNSDDATMLAEALMIIIQDNSLRSRLQQTGLRFVKKNYCLDKKIRDYEDLFIRMCENET